MSETHVLYDNSERLYSLHNSMVQSSAANSLRFIVTFFFLKPMEPALLFWWVKVGKLPEEQREKENRMFQWGAFSPLTTAKALFGC